MILPATAMVAASLSAMPGPLVSVQQKSSDIVDNTIFGKVTLHSLRHTFATRCIESGMPPVVLQTLLGHTDIKITMNTYCSVSEQYSKEQLSAVTGYLNTHNILF